MSSMSNATVRMSFLDAWQDVWAVCFLARDLLARDLLARDLLARDPLADCGGAEEWFFPIFVVALTV